MNVEDAANQSIKRVCWSCSTKYCAACGCRKTASFSLKLTAITSYDLKRTKATNASDGNRNCILLFLDNFYIIWSFNYSLNK